MKQIKSFFWGIFGLLCVIQLGVIGVQIWSYERILKEGEVYYFNVLPLDPYDAFRGRYVTLRFENTQAPIAEGQKSTKYESLGYAILEHQEKFDSVKEITFLKPQIGSFLEVNVRDNYFITTTKNHSSIVYFSLPFDRFYLREDRAPQAEKLLRVRSGVKVKAKLRVLNGKGVIEDLMVGEVPLSSYLTK
jgi:uncharacterized membrane-anchored protein